MSDYSRAESQTVSTHPQDGGRASGWELCGEGDKMMSFKVKLLTITMKLTCDTKRKEYTK